MSETLPDECSLEFNLFGDLLDDIDSENAIIQKKEARKEELEALLKFIGGFEYWPFLNEDCRREVVKHLDYKSRCQLGLCSKADYETVDNTPIYVHSIEMGDEENSHYTFSMEEFENVVVRVQFHHDYNSGKRFDLVFSQLGEDTQIQWTHYIPKKRPENRKVIWKSCNYYGEAVKFAEKWVKKCRYELKAIKITMKSYPLQTSQIKFLPFCTSVQLGADEVETFKWWFEKVPEKLKDLQLTTGYDFRFTYTIRSEFLNAPQIMQATRFYLRCRAAFTDEQFLKLRANSMSFDCVCVTDDGINQFIRNWINGKGPKDFKRALLWGEVPRDEAALIRGLEVRRWDDDFQEEAECLDLIFSQEGEDTRILWLKYLPKKKPEKRQVIVKSCNYYEVAVKFAEKWMRKCNYELSALTVSMSNYPFETSTIKCLPKCRSVSIDAKDMDGIDWWLQKVPEKLDGLFLPYFSDLPSEFWKRPQVTNVSGSVCIPTNLTDEQFLGLKAKHIGIESENITEQGINQFLKQYVNGRRENGVREVIFWSDREWKKNEIIDGLKVQPWTSDFEIEEDAFCDDFRRICGRGEIYQIRSLMDPFESITLQINYDRVGIFGTGKRVTNDGVTSSEFAIPV